MNKLKMPRKRWNVTFKGDEGTTKTIKCPFGFGINQAMDYAWLCLDDVCDPESTECFELVKVQQTTAIAIVYTEEGESNE